MPPTPYEASQDVRPQQPCIENAQHLRFDVYPGCAFPSFSQKTGALMNARDKDGITVSFGLRKVVAVLLLDQKA